MSHFTPFTVPSGVGGVTKGSMHSLTSKLGVPAMLSNRLKLSEGMCCIDYHSSLRCLAIGSTRQLHVVEVISTVGLQQEAVSGGDGKVDFSTGTEYKAAVCSPSLSSGPHSPIAPFVLRNAGVFGGLQKVENVCWYPSKDEATIAFVQPNHCITIFIDALLMKTDGNVVSQQWTRTRGKGKFLQATMEAGGGSTSAAVVNGGGADVCSMATPMTTTSMTSHSASVMLHGSAAAGASARLRSSELSSEGVLQPPVHSTHLGGTPGPDTSGRMFSDNFFTRPSTERTNMAHVESGLATTASVQRPVKGLHAKELIELVIPVSFMRIKKIAWDPHTPYTLALTSPTTSFELWQIPTEGSMVYAPRLVLRPPAHGLRRLVNDIAFAPTDENCIVVVAELANGGQVLLYDRRQVEVPRCIDTTGPGLIAAFHPLFTDLLAVCFRQQKTRPECQIVFLSLDEGSTREAVSPRTPTERDEAVPAGGTERNEGRWWGVEGVAEGSGRRGEEGGESGLVSERVACELPAHDVPRGGGGLSAVMQLGVLPSIQYYATVVRLQWRPSSRGVLDGGVDNVSLHCGAPSSCALTTATPLLSQLWLATLATTTDVDINVWDVTNSLLPVGTVKCAARDGKEPVDFVWINELTLAAVFQSGEVCVTSLLSSAVPTLDGMGPAEKMDDETRQRDDEAGGAASDERERAPPRPAPPCTSTPSLLAPYTLYPRDPSTEVFSLYTILPTCVVVCGLFGHSLAIRNSVTQLRAHYAAVVRRECQELLRYLAEPGHEATPAAVAICAITAAAAAAAGRAATAASSRLSDRSPRALAAEAHRRAAGSAACATASTEGSAAGEREASRVALSAVAATTPASLEAHAGQQVKGTVRLSSTHSRGGSSHRRRVSPERSRQSSREESAAAGPASTTATFLAHARPFRAVSMDAAAGPHRSTVWSRMFGRARRRGGQSSAAPPSPRRSPTTARNDKSGEPNDAAATTLSPVAAVGHGGQPVDALPIDPHPSAAREAGVAAAPALVRRTDNVTRYGQDADSKFRAAMQELRATGPSAARRFREVAAILQSVQAGTAAAHTRPNARHSSAPPRRRGDRAVTGADEAVAADFCTCDAAQGAVDGAAGRPVPCRAVRPVIESFVPAVATAGWGYVERAAEAANFTRYALKWDMGYELALGMRRWRHRREDNAAAAAEARETNDGSVRALPAPAKGGETGAARRDMPAASAETHDNAAAAVITSGGGGGLFHTGGPARQAGGWVGHGSDALRHNPHTVDLRFAEMMLHNARVCSEATSTSLADCEAHGAAAAGRAARPVCTHDRKGDARACVVLHGEGGQAEGGDDPRGQWWRAAAHAWRSHAVDVIVALTVGQLEYGALVGDVQYCLVLYILFCLWWRLRHAECEAGEDRAAAAAPPACCPLMPDPVTFRTPQASGGGGSNYNNNNNMSSDVSRPQDRPAAAAVSDHAVLPAPAESASPAAAQPRAAHCGPAEWKLRALQWLEAYTGALYARRLYVPLNELLLILPEITREPCNPVQPRAADIAYEKQMTYVYCGHCPRSELRALPPSSQQRQGHERDRHRRCVYRNGEEEEGDESGTTWASSDTESRHEEGTSSCEEHHHRHHKRHPRRSRHEETCLMCSAAASSLRSTASSLASLSSSAELHHTYRSDSEAAYTTSSCRSTWSESSEDHAATRARTTTTTTRSDDGSAATTGSCGTTAGSSRGGCAVVPRVDIPVPHNAVCRRCHNPSAMACVICGEVVEGMYYWMRSCGHGGHVHHIQEWLSVSNECPRCGVAITTSAIERRETQSSYV